MFRSLQIAATGMAAQEAQLDAISNNLANSNTVGYKKQRADFEDLVYENLRTAGTPTSSTTTAPTPLQVGSGVRVVATTRIFGQGSLESTGNQLDVAIEGSGFFVVQQPDGTPAYTRAGNLKTDGQGRLCTAGGLLLNPPIVVPADAGSVSIGSDGTVSATVKGQAQPAQLGRLQLASFVNPAGLEATGHNLFVSTPASGEASLGHPGADGRGTLLQGSIEHSNVEVVEEMVGLIAAQRAYEVDTKVISAADDMLRNATQLQ